MSGKAGISTIASLATLFFIPTANAHGCSCYSITPCAAFSQAKAVFVGRMIGGAEKNTEERYDGQVVAYEAGDVNFEVEEVFKGEIGKEFKVFVFSDKSSDCSWPGLRPGERYLIFAREYKGRIVIGQCDAAKIILPARPDNGESRAANKPLPQENYWKYTLKYDLWNAEYGLKFLRSLPQNGKGGILNVSVKMTRDYKPVEGMTIAIADLDKQRYDAVTDEDGEFVFPDLKPGKYTVAAVWPKGYTGYHSPEIEVRERSCAELKLLFRRSGREASGGHYARYRRNERRIGIQVLRLTLDDDVVEMTLTLSQPGYSSKCDEERKQ